MPGASLLEVRVQSCTMALNVSHPGEKNLARSPTAQVIEKVKKLSEIVEASARETSSMSPA